MPPFVGTILRMASRGGHYTDDFNRSLSGSLGSMSSGGLPWTILTGTWNVNGTKPTTATTQSSNPLAVVNPGGPTQTALLTLGAGDALYFRVQDATNWWRLLWEGYQTSSCQTCCSTCCSTCYNYASGHQQQCNSCGSTGPCVDNPDLNCGSYCAGCPDTYCHQVTCSYVTGSYSCNCTSCNCTSCNCTYYNNYRLRLEKMVGGTLTALTIGSAVSTATTRAKVVTQPDGTVMAYYDSNLLSSRVDTALATQSKVGIGRGASNYNTSAIDDFDLTAA